MTNLEKLLPTLTIGELHLAFCKRNYDPYLNCLNCPIYSPSRPCREAFDEWLNKEVEE